MDAKDWFVMLHVGAAWLAATAWIFVHPSVAAFSTWCGLCVTMGGIFHWLIIHDAKTKDAQ